MTPFTHVQTELRLAVQRAQQRADAFMAQTTPVFAARLCRKRLHDHRVAVAGDLADALNQAEPGLGSRFMQALYPEIDLALGDEGDAP